MSRILVTGAAGFIGSSLADKLLCCGHEVIGIDNFDNYYSSKLKQENLKKALIDPNYSFYNASIENIDELDKIFSDNKIDKIVHLAAKVGVRASIENPLSYIQTNIIGTANILEMMKKHNIKHMSIASSSSVYGNNSANQFSENLNIGKPISLYAATKAADEQLCYTYHHLYNLNIYILRFFTVYGPRQRPDLAINKFTDNIIHNKPIDMYGDGKTLRDYTYIDDIVNGIIASLSYNKTGYEIFNLGGGNPITLKEMITTIETATGKKAKINQLPMQQGDVDKTISDISKAERSLGYKPKTPFKEGIKKFVAWKNKQYE